MTGRSIFIVEDDVDTREMLAKFLELEGFEVAVAVNGKQALEMLSAGTPASVILLDLMMPVMDGWEFRRRQKHTPELADIPVVAITAAGQPKQDSIIVDRLLPKPLDLEHVLQALHDYCQLA